MTSRPVDSASWRPASATASERAATLLDVSGEPRDDFDLLAAWREGDRAAGQELARRHYKVVRRFITGKLGEEAARDLAQRVFLTLCEKRDDFEGRSSFRTYLLGIARFKVIETVRKQRGPAGRFDPVEDSVCDPNLEVTLGSLLGKHEHERIVVQALHSLALDDQFLLELKAVEGMKNREIAEVLETTTGAIGGKIVRARERLAKAVAQLTEDPMLRTATDRRLDDWVASVCAKMSDFELQAGR